MDVLVVDVHLADRSGQTRRACFTWHGQSITKDDLAPDIDIGVVIGHARRNVDNTSGNATRASGRAERIAIGIEHERVRSEDVERGPNWIADKSFALEALDLVPEPLKLILDVVEGARLLR